MNISKRLLVLLITVSMLLSGSFVQAFAEEETVDSASVAVPESVSEEDPEDTAEAEEVVEKEETAPAEEETPASVEETQKLSEPAESDKPNEKSEEAAGDADNKDAEASTSGKLTFECDEYTVTLEYGKKAGIPEGTVLDVREISSDTDDAKEQKEYETYYDRSLEQLRSEKGGDTIAKLGFARFYDITLVSGGKEIEPGDDVKVTFKYSKDSRESVKEGNKEGDAIRVIHMMESGKNGEIKAKPIEKKDTDLTLDKKELTEAAFTTDSFSVYGIVYTVDFEYEGYTYSILGESEIMLSDLFESLHIEESIKDVKNVEFTDYSLIKIEKTGEDWKLISLKPFNTEEKLTVTLEDKIIEIKVTDADSNNTFLLYRVRNANEYFKTRLYISRSGGSTTLAGNSGTTVIHDGSEGWMDLETFVKKYDEKYVFPRYSVIAAGDQGDGDRALCAAGFFSTQLTGLHGTAGLYPVTRTVGIFSFEGSASDTKYDIDITLNDNSLPVKVYVDENLEYDDVLIEQSDSKTYTVTELLAVLGYDGYDVKSSKIGTDDVSSVSVEELTGTSLAGKTISRPAVPVTAPPTYYTNAFSYTYPKAYKWTYNSGTAVGDDTLIINLETPIARVSNDGGNTWTYHSYLINNGTQGDGVTKIGAFDQANSLSDDVIIEMLYDIHDRYTLDDGYTFNNSRISSLTIKGTDSKSTLVKNQTTAPLITTTGISKVEFDNIIFNGNDKNTTNNNGGAVNTNTMELIVSNCEFSNCQAGLQGGGIYHNNKEASVEITNTTFNSCCANGTDDPKAGGGGIFTNALELRVIKSEFNDIESKKQAAGIFHKRDKNDDPNKETVTIISGCKFNNCEAAWSGGGVETDAFNITINDTDFNGCKGVKGGAVNVYVDGQETSQGSKLNVTDCKFESCECFGNTASHGGAVNANAETLTVSNCEFNNCQAGLQGGGIYHSNNRATLTITNSQFSSCIANGTTDPNSGGGGIFSDALNLNVNNSIFNKCGANRQGAGIFHKRKQNDSISTCTVAHCTFIDCVSVHSGGGMESDAFHITVANSTFNNCKATTAEGKGGAINVYANAQAAYSGDTILNIDICKFYECTSADNGGAVRSTAVKTNISDSYFDKCTSGQNGGAIACTNNNTETAITDCNISDCHADSGNGGACFTNGKNLTMSSGTISGCSATKGGAIYSTSQITMTGGSVTGNTTGGDSAALDAEKEKPGFYFQGDIVIKGNTGSNGEARDVYLGKDTDQHIQINRPGLGSTASIGVYVADSPGGVVFEKHGKPYTMFARTEDRVLASSLINLDKLFSDRLDNGEMHGMAVVEGSGNSRYRIMWGVVQTPVAPTNVDLQLLPYILILIGGAVLVLMKKVSDRRRKTENEGDQDA